MRVKQLRHKDYICGRFFIKVFKLKKKVNYFFNNNLSWCNIFLTSDGKGYIIAYGMLFNPTNKPRNLSVIKIYETNLVMDYL